LAGWFPIAAGTALSVATAVPPLAALPVSTVLTYVEAVVPSHRAVMNCHSPVTRMPAVSMSVNVVSLSLVFRRKRTFTWLLVLNIHQCPSAVAAVEDLEMMRASF